MNLTLDPKSRQLNLLDLEEYTTDTHLDVFRPIQYLGSKMRTVDCIVDQVQHLEPRPQVVWDLFTGSTVVAQALAQRGHDVTATDAMRYSVVFARALLGVGKVEEVSSVDELLNQLEHAATPDIAREAFRPWYLREIDALRSKDVDELIQISRDVPQVWRPSTASRDLQHLFQQLAELQGQPAFSLGGLLTGHYAGTYFGVSQALEIDQLRIAIEQLWRQGLADGWIRNVLLTTLLSVISDSVFSAGKHFAQPYRLGNEKDLSFLRRRILKDRSIEISSTFANRLLTVLRHANLGQGCHHAFQLRFESVTQDTMDMVSRVDAIYADPPYTAQQYSRFYHIPETLVLYEVPELQTYRGRITRGLYPRGRHKSPFCSKRKAPKAFAKLFRLAESLDATLLVSYSDTKSGATGNERMVSLEDILALARRYYGSSASLVELDHEYRQFNRSESAVAGHVREVLLVCE